MSLDLGNWMPEIVAAIATAALIVLSWRQASRLGLGRTQDRLVEMLRELNESLEDKVLERDTRIAYLVQRVRDLENGRRVP